MTDNPVKVLVYSDNRLVREQVRVTLGKKVAADLPEVEVLEVATPAALLRALDSGSEYSLVVLDGEAQPSGGFGLAHQLKEEYHDCPPVMLLIVREVDTWLATWSRADAITPYPLDPFEMPRQAADLLRARVG
ncbi:response regulator transcription factor [Tessaracoccus sp. OH4464_COT-324]|uniref:response regulator transcription factor n=1 Tax=Tessaracoccus sp. OH4464_COT-324 TaxID=2491059 RepID=UPI000F62FFB4|nr:response regulator transcription factor [Tessaracoccus sp. OH4464_COT-324]RRD45755.1 response regulator [Tessaracoccus sp. OH4464_COT-324]